MPHGPPRALQPQVFGLAAWLQTPSQQSVLGCVGGGFGSQMHGWPLVVQLPPPLEDPLDDPLEDPPLELLDASCPASVPVPDELPLEPPLPLLLLLAPLLLVLPLLAPLLPPLPLPVPSAVLSPPPPSPPPLPPAEPLEPHATPTAPAATNTRATSDDRPLRILTSYTLVRGRLLGVVGDYQSYLRQRLPSGLHELPLLPAKEQKNVSGQRCSHLEALGRRARRWRFSLRGVSKPSPAWMTGRRPPSGTGLRAPRAGSRIRAGRRRTARG